MMAGSRLVAVLSGLLLLGGCGGGTATVATLDGASCYPPDAGQWVSESLSAESAVAPDPGGPLAIYLDGSASMSGYIRGGSAEARPLADLVGMLPSLGGIDHSKAEVIRFDRKITPIESKDIKAMQSEAGYLCPPSNSNCDAQESHIDQALDKIAHADASGLSVVVSDLWLANSAVLTTDSVALSGPLDLIFNSGRSIAVYGFESAYAGKVSDLPSGKAGVVASRRYLFVVAVGPLKRLQAFNAAMQMAPSSSISSDLKSGKAHYSLFTLEPAVAADAAKSAFVVPTKSALMKANFLPVRSGVKVQQFKLDKSAALRSPVGSGASWAGSRAVSVIPGAVWEGASRGETQLYKLVDEECRPKGGGWRKEGELRGGWQGETGDYTLDPAGLAALPSGKYLLIGGLRRVSLLSPNPATQWMRDWSFNAATEAEALRRPVMPTLNLSEMARLFEVALLRSAQQKPMNIGGFAVAVEIN